MRRLNVVLSDQASEHLEELRELWGRVTGNAPSTDVLIQRALEDYHRSYVGAADNARAIKKPSQLSAAANPGGLDRQVKAI